MLYPLAPLTPVILPSCPSQLDEFTALVDLFKPVMHTLLLIWKHSGHYNVAPRFVTLVLEICNDLIMQVSRSDRSRLFDWLYHTCLIVSEAMRN